MKPWSIALAAALWMSAGPALAGQTATLLQRVTDLASLPPAIAAAFKTAREDAGVGEAAVAKAPTGKALTRTLAKAEPLRVDLAGNKSVTLVRTGKKAGGIWLGRVDGVGETVMLVVDAQGISGKLPVGDQLHTIEPLGQGYHVVVRVDFNTLPQEHPTRER